jgi:hypothetical protein
MVNDELENVAALELYGINAARRCGRCPEIKEGARAPAVLGDQYDFAGRSRLHNFFMRSRSFRERQLFTDHRP